MPNREAWRTIKHHPLYEVSDAGRVRRAVPGPSTHAGFVLRPSVNQKGYHRVELRDGIGNRRMCAVHRLVLATFGSEPVVPQHAHHRNADRADNGLGNLEWVSNATNLAEAVRRGAFCGITHPSMRGEGNPAARLTADQVREIRSRHTDGESQRGLARQFNVNPQTVNYIVRHKTWRHVREG